MQRALDDAGIPYEVVRGPWRPARRAAVLAGTGQPLYPALELGDGRWYREESAEMARTIREGRLAVGPREEGCQPHCAGSREARRLRHPKDR